ncbi:MAG TPA: two-component system response regulator CreB [Permianibacter sp.]|nr:two-component system response regulator CreB [Permianibacter sp.]
METILLVEDEPAIAATIIYALEQAGYRVQHCQTGHDALAAAATMQFNLFILDVGLPDQTGFSLCQTLRQQQPTPVLFLTARNDAFDRIVGLELGADDYLGKPFSPRELVLRVQVILRRHHGGEAAIANAQTLNKSPAFVHHLEQARVLFRGKLLTLTKSEYRLLATLLAQPERVFSRDQLLDALGPNAEDSGDRSIDTLIKQLRAKLRSIDANCDPISTHRGLGYSLKRLD